MEASVFQFVCDYRVYLCIVESSLLQLSVASNNEVFRGVAEVVQHLADQMLCDAAIGRREVADSLDERFMGRLGAVMGKRWSGLGGAMDGPLMGLNSSVIVHDQGVYCDLKTLI